MLTGISGAQLIGAWFAAVIVMMACSVAGGTALTINTGEMWLAACLVPPALMLLVWRAAPVAVAELLDSVNRQSKDGRP